MPRLSRIDMTEATRLTREGRLQEAMALLQGASPALATPPRHGKGPTARSSVPPIDMEPPSAGSGGAWTAPFASASSRDPESARTSGDVPNILRGLRDRLAGLGDLRAGAEGPFGSFGTAQPPSQPDGARFEEHVYANAAGSRPYKLYVPSTLDDSPRPLVVMLHGCTQSPDDFAAGTRMNELAEEFGLLVAYPAQTQAANMSRCWNWFNAADQQRDRGEPSLIAGITRTIMERHPVDPARVYVAGLSAGGAKAAIMAATYPDLYAAVGVHSGLACGAARDMGSAFAAMRQGGATPDPLARPDGERAPTIVFHGDRDRTVHPVNGDQVAAQATAGTRHRIEVSRGRSSGGMDFTRTIHHDEAGLGRLEQWVLHGAGHAWSGGSPAGSYTDPRGPDASREMLRFFLTHESARPSRR
ncbi:extracellular catalytic domain type 1 short-chain-length polyhydroxyalkanoate depolymerase [Rubellimicrobium roseum]|uniref:PHB depolymerase family esterase n=1 Tax=Rubellimicrobium roseum TaxID=687525 RepID=A0A5C4NPH3_9RHOB|nr:PHB depolymerase family esterase [Rubellimicrobium roseum]TNC74966.1 PHB depolymerase family esterase [Rubellimicrobium roseum]